MSLKKTSLQLDPHAAKQLLKLYDGLTISEIVRLSMDYVLEKQPELWKSKLLPCLIEKKTHSIKIHRGGGIELINLEDELPILTPKDHRFLSVAATAASPEVDELIKIIERLTGEKVIPVDNRGA